MIRFRPGYAAAFTMIELLVVVSIIAVLAAMLLPVISIVRGMALNSTCANNLRMLTMATHGYCNDNDGALPYCQTEYSPWTDWYDSINPYIDETYQANVYAGTNAFRCPLAVREVQDQYQFQGRFSFQYSINDNLRAWWVGTWASGRPPVPLSKTRAGQVLFSDACIIRNGPGEVRYVLPNQYDVWNTWAGPPWPVGGNNACFDDPVPASSGSVPILRHRGRVTQSFIDGHVAPVIGTWDAAIQTAAYRR
jgi:prepilin-type N-terminal cleavage/methylation domain-containing protein/prepilin-type processing-associated H-X9-DG protein